DKGIEVDHFIPIFGAEENNRHGLSRFGGLNQRQYLEKFIDRAVTTGKDNESFRKINKPELAHEEIVEVENQFGGDIAVHALLVWQLNIETEASTACQMGSAIGRLHHSSRAAGADDEVVMTGERPRPLRQPAGQLHRVLIVASELDSGFGARSRLEQFS